MRPARRSCHVVGRISLGRRITPTALSALRGGHAMAYNALVHQPAPARHRQVRQVKTADATVFRSEPGALTLLRRPLPAGRTGRPRAAARPAGRGAPTRATRRSARSRTPAIAAAPPPGLRGRPGRGAARTCAGPVRRADDRAGPRPSRRSSTPESDAWDRLTSLASCVAVSSPSTARTCRISNCSGVRPPYRLRRLEWISAACWRRRMARKIASE